MLYRYKNVLEVLYHLAKFSRAWISPAPAGRPKTLIFRSSPGDVLIDLLLEVMSVHPSTKSFSDFHLIGVWVDLDHICAPVWPRPDLRSRSRGFRSSKNCSVLRLSPLPFWCAAQNWWLITTVWDLVYSYSDLDFWIYLPVGGHVTSKFVKWNVHITGIHWVLSPHCLQLSWWLSLQVGHNKPWMLAAMTVSPLVGLFIWLPYEYGRPLYFVLWFLSSSFFLLFFLA